MRIVLLLFLLINLGLAGVGQGWFGPVPADAGRGPVPPAEVSPERIQLQPQTTNAGSTMPLSSLSEHQ